MDYVVGSVAALISGNVTPNRPRLLKRALTPTKHQSSPNVTPKSEIVDDRSIFLSPTLQKKKAIVKKSPKRIFDNPDLDATADREGNSSLTSPKADKVKKHLEDELEADKTVNTNKGNVKSPKKVKNKLDKSEDPSSPNKKAKIDDPSLNLQSSNESTPKKKKKQRNSISTTSEILVYDDKENVTIENSEKNAKLKVKSPKKNKKLVSNTFSTTDIDTREDSPTTSTSTPKKNKKRKKSESKESEIKNLIETVQIQSNEEKSNKKKKNKNRKKKSKTQNNLSEQSKIVSSDVDEPSTTKKSKKTKNIVNPNAITNDDTDSEHESDNELESETEQANNEILNEESAEASSDEEEEKPQNVQKQKKEFKGEQQEEEEVKRTLFVGNVPFSDKCKKEIKRIFSKYGDIETVRIRTVPVKDARVTPKLAVIKSELHPDRSTVNVYIKFADQSSVEDALAENNTVLNNYHLRVSRSESTGAAHDPRCAVFVGNLPFALEDEALRDKFRDCGEIQSVRIVRDKKTNAGKGFGYVNFASKDGVELALAMTEEDLTIKNRILRVKRCSYIPHKQGKSPGNQGKGSQGKFQNQRMDSRNFQGSKFQGNQNIQGRNQDGSFRGRNQGGGFQGRNQGSGFQGRNQGGGFQGRNQGGNFQGRNQGGNFQGRNQGGSFRGRNQGNFHGGVQGRNQRNDAEAGAYRRIMNKRPHQDEGDGPPHKLQRANEPREKKPKKEFVGMTAGKKKHQKPKFNKAQKKKQALSQILTKQL